jgi:hypothetical protein
MVFFSTVSSVSPKYRRRSLCPTITQEQPDALIIGPETSPVNAIGLPIEVLCSNSDATSARGFNGIRDIEERWADHSLAMSGGAQQGQKGLEKGSGAEAVLVHLPISADQRCAQSWHNVIRASYSRRVAIVASLRSDRVMACYLLPNTKPDIHAA